jgi:hypothetical protein
VCSSDLKIVRKIWHKDLSFEESDVTTWTLVHTFADDTAYNDTIATFNELLTAATYGSIPFTLAQTWEEVTAAAALLDGYTDDLVGAFAPVLLVPDYSGPCMRIRRSGDNAETDIGFDGIDLNRDAIANFCSPGDGFVKTWYDQSGNGKDGTQSTTALQPKIYDASTGVIVDANGVPRLSLLGSENLAFGNFSLTEAHGFVGFSKTALGDFGGFVTSKLNNNWGLANGEIRDGFYNYNRPVISGSGTIAANTPYLISAKHNGTMTWHVNGVQKYNSTGIYANATNVQLKGDYNFNGYYSFVILYSADKSADRAAIETALNDYFNIY